MLGVGGCWHDVPRPIVALPPPESVPPAGFAPAFADAHAANDGAAMRRLVETHRDRARPEAEQLVRQALAEADPRAADALLARAHSLGELVLAVSDDPVPLETARRISRATPEQREAKRIADRALAEARQAFVRGDLPTAADGAAAAAERFAGIGDTPGEIAALNLLGQAQRGRALYAASEAAHAGAAAMAERSRDRPALAAARRGLGDVLERQKDHVRAVAVYEEALAVLRIPEDWRQASEVLQNLADIYVVSGQFEQAIEADRLALRYAQQARDAAATARARDYLGYAHRKLGDYETAERWHREALRDTDAIADADERHRARARAFNHLGLVLHAAANVASGAGDRTAAERQLGEAILSEEQALEEAGAVADRSRQGYILRALVQMHLDAARLEQRRGDLLHLQRAAELAERARVLGQAMGRPEWEGLALHHLAQALVQLGRGAEAAQHLDEALAIWTRIGDAYSGGYLHVLRARELLERNERHDDALEEYARAKPLFERISAVGELTDLAQRQALLHERQGRNGEAERLYREALALAEPAYGAAHPAVARNLVLMSALYLAQDRATEALDLARRATQINRTRGERGNAARSTGGIASRASPAAGYRSHVIAAYASAADSPELRKELTAEAFDVVQLAQSVDVARSLARMSARFAAGNDALATAVRAYEDAYEQRRRLDQRLLETLASTAAQRDEVATARLRIDLAAAQARLDMLDAQLHRDFPAYAELSNPRPVTLRDVQGLLQPEEALLLYAVTERATFLWVLRHDRADMHRIEIGRTALAEEVTQLRDRLDPARNPKFLPFDVERAYRLHQRILAPAGALLEGARHVIVVPDEALQSLPIGVLVTDKPRAGQPTPWLARRLALSVLPSVSSLRALRGVAGDSVGAAPFLGVGDPALDGRPGDTKGNRATRLFRGKLADVKAVRALAALPETAEELTAMARMFGASSDAVWLRTKATEPQVRSADLSAYRVIAFATHGLMADEVVESGEPALVMTPPEQATEEDDGLLTASEIAKLRLNADWVILSACNTAAPDGSPGADGLSGLAKAFFHAGSRAILVSHWLVESLSSARLTTGAIAAMAKDKGIGRAEALRRSAVLLMADRDYGHPMFWAPFVVVGEGGKGR